MPRSHIPHVVMKPAICDYQISHAYSTNHIMKSNV